jgi:hypothetical protein
MGQRKEFEKPYAFVNSEGRSVQDENLGKNGRGCQKKEAIQMGIIMGKITRAWFTLERQLSWILNVA